MVNNFSEYFKIAARNLKMRSLRSWLTVLGIIIGVFLIISLLSLSEGIKETINRQMMSLGGNMIFVMPGDDSNPLAGMMFGGDKLEARDLDAIRRTEGVKTVLGASYQSINVRYNTENKALTVEGFPLVEGADVLRKFQGWSLSSGRWPSASRREVVVGMQFGRDIFNAPVQPGDQLIIKGKKYTVAGILNSLGAKDDDSAIFMDIAEFQDLTGQQRGTAQIAMVQIDEAMDPNLIAEKIKDSLRRVQRRAYGSDDLHFAVITAEKVNDIVGGVMAVIQFAILAFAGIAILVGGIGITNTMYTYLEKMNPRPKAEMSIFRLFANGRASSALSKFSPPLFFFSLCLRPVFLASGGGSGGGFWGGDCGDNTGLRAGASAVLFHRLVFAVDCYFRPGIFVFCGVSFGNFARPAGGQTPAH